MVGSCCRPTSSCEFPLKLNIWGVDIDSYIHRYRFQPYLVLNDLHLPGCRGDGDCPATTKSCSNGTCAQTLNVCGDNLSVLSTEATMRN